MKEKFWTCRVSERMSPKSRHATLAEAIQEAERLAKLQENVGREVYILEMVACCKVPLEVAWVEVRVNKTETS